MVTGDRGYWAEGWIVVSLIGVIPNAAQFTPAGPLELASALVLGTQPPHVAVSVLANLALLVLLVALAWYAFRRQELVVAG